MSRKNRRRKHEEPNSMTIRGHIHELKTRIIVCILAFLAFFVLFYIKSDTVFPAILKIGETAGYTFSYLSPYETLLQVLRCCLLLAVFAASPVIVFEIISYVMPAFDKRSHFIIFVCSIFSFVLFILGIIFCIKILLPFVYSYMYEYSTQYDVKSNVSIEKYVSSFVSFSMILGIVFELPLICGCLSKIGVLSSEAMLHYMRPIIIVIMIVSAIITPPDVVSMIIVAVPIFIVYLFSILVCCVVRNRKK